MSSHRHLSEEDLLELLLNPRASEVPRGRCESCDERRAELGAFLDSCRAELLPQTSCADPLVERILAATTGRGATAPGERLGVTGDLRLVIDFARQRLRHSRLLRVAAASLLAHLIALPVLAWYASRQAAPPEPRIGFVIPEPTPEAWEGPVEPTREVSVPASLEPSGEATEVRTVPVNLPVQPGSRASLEVRLGELLAAIDGGGYGNGLRASEANAAVIDRILWGELLLNRLSSSRSNSGAGPGAGGEGAAHALAAWRALASGLPVAADQLADLDRATRTCLGALWARAEALGELTSRARAPLASLRAGEVGNAALLRSTLKRSAAQEASWRALVLRAGAAAGAPR
ncbi:MAG TPA: hypothetical protein QF730_03580 [Planctomycetota bacterium]|nr:hypothetical protein [Planctomycetota bacterium]